MINDLTGNNYITIESIEDYDGVNLFSTSQQAIDNINNFHLLRYYIYMNQILKILIQS